MKAALAGAVCALIAAVGCSAGSSSPVAPAPAPPTASSIAITSGVDSLRTGFFADFAVTASMSDRTTQIVTPQATLTTSDASIATVDKNGRLTANWYGPVTITASYQGRTATRTVTIVYNYGGTWNGTFVIRDCDQSGLFLSSRYCQNAGVAPLPMALELTQSGANADQISGSASFRGLAGPVTGQVGSDGRLALNGSYTAASGGATFRVEIVSWTTEPAGNTGMSGRFHYKLQVMGSEGTASQINEIVSVNKKPETTSRR
jgi:hypothetical protein